MERGATVGELTSGASGRIIPVLRNIRRSVPSPASLLRVLFFLLHSLALWFLLFLRRRRPLSSKTAAAAVGGSPRQRTRGGGGGRWWAAAEEEDARRRRALAEEVEMVPESAESEEGGACRWRTFDFVGPRRRVLFCRSWLPASGDLRCIMVIIHGLNEHSGRYSYFAKQLMACNFGVYAMDWIEPTHGGLWPDWYGIDRHRYINTRYVTTILEGRGEEYSAWANRRRKGG
ncbi:Monoglyceride lipase [Musa troglodytarum]|uniref:Monoglyceride lipase n=1 Tax=Musa troglodytarum TaxID=320322 RepID=A0A9E7L7Q3_9LILI|nr:Monoglyceride lipase [Musa troglodytarum]